MFRRERGVVYGVMNDFDLGQISDVEREGYKGERTGTRPFMSISLHLGRGQTQIPEHIERFDLESVFYVMFWEGRLSNNGELYATKAAKDAYKRWNGNDDISLIAAKGRILWAITPRHLNESYRPLVAQWLKPLGKIFDNGYQKLHEFRGKCIYDDPDYSVPVDWEIPGFDYDTLGGNVTFENIWNIIKD